MTIDKTAALERLAALENEAQELRKIIEAPAPAKSLLSKPEPGSGMDYWALYFSNSDKGVHALTATDWEAHIHTARDYAHGNFFQSEQLAKGYALAIDTLLLLRHQPGTQPAIDNKMQYLLVLSHGEIVAQFTYSNDRKIARLSPCFYSEDYAKQAINAIGEARLMHMFKTFHHVGE